VVVKIDGQPVGKVDILSPAAVPQANAIVRLLRKVGINP
jgi:hypothetical protein